MSIGRCTHTATLLENGQILIAGGKSRSGTLFSNVDLFTPSINTFTNTSNMNIKRAFCTSTLLSDHSTVLATGGIDANNSMIPTAELYINGSWIFTTNAMTIKRVYHAAVLLNDGNVLITGGGNGVSSSLAIVEIYNVTTRNFTAVGSMKYRRDSLTLTLLTSGKVLATGGIDWNTGTYPQVCELYDPVTRSWSDTLILNNGRTYHQTVLLNDSVATVGGYDVNRSNILASSDRYCF